MYVVAWGQPHQICISEFLWKQYTSCIGHTFVVNENILLE
jgi:hypothetical protein